MQIQVDPGSFTQHPLRVALPAPRSPRLVHAKSASQPALLGIALIRGGSQRYEMLVWLGLSLAGLAVVVVSFYQALFAH